MSPTVTRLLVVVAVIAVVALVGWWAQRRPARVRTTGVDDPADAPRVAREHLDALDLDLDGADAGAVLLGSPTCAPCTTVKQVLRELADDRPGFRWRYADAADHLDLAREHRVLRVPTLLVIDASGRLLARTSGVPDAADLAAVLDRGAELSDAAA